MRRANRNKGREGRSPKYQASQAKDSSLIGRTGVIMLGITGLVFGGVLLLAYKPGATSHSLADASIKPPEIKQAPVVVEDVQYDRQPVRTELLAKAPTSTGSGQGEKFGLCDKRPVSCVVDGDTFWISGVKYRIADIDTPEVRSPKCPSEKALGIKATYRLIELLNAGPFELHAIGNREYDRYGRTLRVVVRNGYSLGDQLVSEGLAHQWGGYREPWCGIN